MLIDLEMHFSIETYQNLSIIFRRVVKHYQLLL